MILPANEYIIYIPSFNLSPYAPVLPTFSEPAKSTRLITDNFSDLRTPSDLISFNSIYIIVCALDEL